MGREETGSAWCQGRKEAEASGVKASAFLLHSPVSATSFIYPVPSSHRVVAPWVGARGGRRGGETKRGNRGGPGGLLRESLDW
jgi:hypothetical protein